LIDLLNPDEDAWKNPKQGELKDWIYFNGSPKFEREL